MKARSRRSFFKMELLFLIAFLLPVYRSTERLKLSWSTGTGAAFGSAFRNARK
jgi:hypothetical protein